MTDTTEATALPLELKAALSVSEEGDVEGIAWPYGSGPDRVNDTIAPGAFGTPGTNLPMLWNHDPGEVIGTWTDVRETPLGLAVKGKLLAQDVARAREVRAMIRAGAATGLSIGFRTRRADRTAEGRTITALDLHEISVVAMPSHPAARVTAIKAATPAGSPAPSHEKGKESVEPEVQTTPEETKAAPAPANTTPQVPALDTKAYDAVMARLDRLEAKSQRPGAVHVTGPGADALTETKAFAGFLRTGDPSEVKSLAYGTGTGGILAPETVSKSILEKVAEFSPVRSVASVIQMNGPLLQLPRLVDDVTVGERTETGAATESEPTFEQIDLKPFEMAVIVPVTKVLLEDAQVDLSGYLGGHIARKFGQKEAQWFVTGNGVTQAEGVLTSADVPNNEVAAINGDALIDHYYAVKTAYAATGAWFMNRKTMAVVRKLKDADGQYLWQSAIAAGQPATILGRPVYEAVDMPDPAAGTTPIVFGDFATGYAIADRVGFEIVRDELTGASTGLVKFIARRRVGGRVVLPEALAKLSLAA